MCVCVSVHARAWVCLGGGGVGLQLGYLRQRSKNSWLFRIRLMWTERLYLLHRRVTSQASSREECTQVSSAALHSSPSVLFSACAPVDVLSVISLANRSHGDTIKCNTIQ